MIAFAKSMFDNIVHDMNDSVNHGLRQHDLIIHVRLYLHAFLVFVYVL